MAVTYSNAAKQARLEAVIDLIDAGSGAAGLNAMNEPPLIYTSRGNLPMASLQYATRWEEGPEWIKFVETYSFDGEVVRESAHVYTRRGLACEPIAQQL